MTPSQLHEEIVRHRAAGLDAMPMVFPAGWKRPRHFPRIELLCVNGRGERVGRVKLDALERMLESALEEVAAAGRAI